MGGWGRRALILSCLSGAETDSDRDRSASLHLGQGPQLTGALAGGSACVYVW